LANKEEVVEEEENNSNNNNKSDKHIKTFNRRKRRGMVLL